MFARPRRRGPVADRAERGARPVLRAPRPTSLISLGDAAEDSGAPLVASDPVIRQIRGLAKDARAGDQERSQAARQPAQDRRLRVPAEDDLRLGGSVNGFDSYGHFLRALIPLQNCFDYTSIPQSGCSAKFGQTVGATRRAADERAAEARSRARRGASPDASRLRSDRRVGDDSAERRAEPGRGRPTGADGPGAAIRGARRRRRPTHAARSGADRADPGDGRRPAGTGAATPDAARLPDRRAGGGAEASDEARRLAGLAASPTMVGALTVMVVILAVFLAYNANNGLPFVPTYRISVEVPNADLLVPGNEVRVGGVRVGSVETIEPRAGRGRQRQRPARPEARQRTSSRCRSTRPSSSAHARRSASSTWRSTRATSSSGYPRGRWSRSPQAQPEPVEIDQVLNTFDEPTRVAIQAEPVRVRQRARRPRAGAQRGARRRCPAVLELLAAGGAATSPIRDTASARFVQALAATSAEVAPGRRDAGASCSSRSTPPSARSPRVARPFIQETISESPPTLDAGDRGAAGDPPVPGPQRDAVHRPRAGRRRRSPTTAPVLTDALADRDARSCATRRSSTAQLAPTAEALLRFNDDAAARAGLDRLQQTVDDLRPDAPLHHPGADRLQLRDAAVPQPRQHVRPGQQRRPLAAVHASSSRPTGPNNEGTFASAPGQRRQRRHRQLPALQPVPEHRRARARRASARPATSPTRSASR